MSLLFFPPQFYHQFIMVQVEKTFDNPGDDFTCEPPFFSLKKNSLMVMEREREK